jgi:MFS family permease
MRISYPWVIVAIGGLMGCVALGTMFSLAIFLEPMSTETGWSRAGISSAMTLNFIVMGLGAFAWGTASDRYGPRVVVLVGAVLLGLALVLASRTTSLLMFQLTYGVIVGVSASAFFAPMIAAVTGWFEHSGPIFHMVSFAIFCGIAPMTAVSIYSVEGLAGLGGRILLGLLGDRYGAKPVLIAGLIVQAFAIAAYVLVSRLGEFYALAVVFGMAYGGTMPLYAVLAREYFGQHIIGTVFGAATMLSSLGMAFGPLAGGWIFDTFATYSWLFIGSAAVGLAAVAVALAFPPVPRQQLQPA